MREHLQPLAEALDRGTYNTVFVVDYGRGPTKVATGPDNAFARYVENWPSGMEPITVGVEGGDALLGEAPP